MAIDREALRQAIRRRRLMRWEPMLLALAREGIDLESELVRGGDGELPVGCSKFGGEPDLPPHFAWPVEVTRPLTFVAQLDLTEMAEIAGGLLPKSGWLYFFVTDLLERASDSLEGTSAPEPLPKQASRVLYFDGSLADLARTPTPADLFRLPGIARVVHLFNPCRLASRPLVTLPDLELFCQLADPRVGDAAQAQYLKLLDEFPYSHRMLGYCDPLCGDEMPLYSELAAHAREPTPRRQRLVERADTWLLLAQFETDGDRRSPWGNCGTIYFWIRRRDLVAHEFADCWTIHQRY